MPRNEPFKTYRDERQVCLETAAGKREYLGRIEEMVTRQSHLCPLCNGSLLLHQATFEHEAGRGIGGGHRDDRLLHDDGNWRNAAVHYTCNGRKGSQRFHWVGMCFIPARYATIQEYMEVA